MTERQKLEQILQRVARRVGARGAILLLLEGDEIEIVAEGVTCSEAQNAFAFGLQCAFEDGKPEPTIGGYLLH